MFSPTPPARRRPWERVTLAQLERIKDWRELHRTSHPIERRAWETVLTLWMMGWIGWLPAFASGASWAYPLCLMGMMSLRIYVYLRVCAHQTGQLRCDWLDLVDEIDEAGLKEP